MAAIKECATLKLIGEWNETHPKNVRYVSGVCVKEFIEWLYKNNYLIVQKERRGDYGI